MKPHRRTAARASCSILCLSLLLLLRLPAPAARAAAQAPEPRALVKSVVVGGQEVRAEVDAGRAQLTRADGTPPPALGPGVALYDGDTIQTSADTRVTVLFLDPPVPERGNEVIIAADSRVSISSTYSWWGTVWVKVKGAFNSRTKYVRLGARGTEYEFSVARDEERSTAVVLEGSVEVTKGAFGPRAGLGRPAPAAGALRPRPAFFATPASYAPRGSQEYGRALDVQAGQVVNYEYTFRIENQCRKPHHFTFHTSAGADWLKVRAADGAAVPPGRTVPISATVTVDGTRLAPGVYRARIYSQCVECEREPQCNQRQLEWPINLTVKGGATPTSTPTGTEAGRDISVLRELEEATLTRGPDRAARADAGRVLAVLDWTNDVILSSQPSYPARNVLPHFNDRAQRGQNFRAARQSAVLGGNPPGSNKTLGDVYGDWGEGARAVNAYEKESQANPARLPAGFGADFAEAYRLTGQLRQAEAKLTEASAADASSARFLNARGNLALERARVALDRQDAGAVRAELGQARAAYEAAAPPGAGEPRGAAVVLTNQGETLLLAAELALREKNAEEARRQAADSEQRLNAARQADPAYPFAVTDLGRAYQRLGNAAALARNRREAEGFYARAEKQHQDAARRHPDMAEAYLHLGDLHEDRGDRESAKRSYEQAIRVRPEQPDSYLPLALLIKDEDPRRAAELAAVFLRLLPEVFKQGERARLAERVRRGEAVTPPPRLVPALTDIPVDDGGGPAVTDVTVPDVVRKSRDDALRDLKAAGLNAGRIERRGGARDSDPVASQRPAAGAKVARGSAVDLVLEPSVRVPSFKGDALERARREITERGLTVGQITYQESCKDVGEVLAQNPRDGERVARGAAVNLTVGSVGENAVRLPNWVGRGRASVEEEIRGAGLTVGRVSEVEREETTPRGQVVRQDPGAGTQLARGCEVNLEVAVPVVPVVVGDYVGMPADEALSLLSRAGLFGLTRRTVARAEPGRVVGQSHPPGSRVRKGTFVTLLVSAQQQVVQMPYVVGMKVAEASAVLRQLGLRVNVVLDNSGELPAGVVYSQSPDAKEPVAVGSTVTIRAGKGGGQGQGIGRLTRRAGAPTARIFSSPRSSG